MKFVKLESNSIEQQSLRYGTGSINHLGESHFKGDLAIRSCNYRSPFKVYMQINGKRKDKHNIVLFTLRLDISFQKNRIDAD